ncbi:MAG: polyprenyl synthetase family protein [Candidatus Omnitrophica bacterium]|nr:polyprenyl synthetase family protein [Candidatus Omnitrophota bacterium]
MSHNREVKAKDFLCDIFSPVKKELSLWGNSYKDILTRKEKEFFPLCEYLLSLPQREIRPGLVFLSAKSVCRNSLDTLNLSSLDKFAVSIEVFNTAILLQNSVMQNIDEEQGENLNSKRGQRSYTLLFSEYLFSRTFGLLIDVGQQEIIKRFMNILDAMIEVKIKEKNPINNFEESEYIERIKNKTASLMSTACWAGASIVGGEGLFIKAVENFGLNFGLTLQIVDDCLNIISEEESFIQELENKKINFSCIYPFSFLSREEKREIFNFLRNRATMPRARILALVYRAVELALKKAKLFSDKAKKDINCLPQSKFKESLIALADFPLERLAK